MVDETREHGVRQAAFARLDQLIAQHPDAVPAARLLEGFEWQGRRFTLMGQGPGIWKPRGLDAALSILTAPPKPGEPPPYDDDWLDETQLRYAYRGTDPSMWQNAALRLAYEHQLPIVYLYGVAKSRYLPVYPAFVGRDRPAELAVDVVFQAGDEDRGVAMEIDGRAYVTRPTRQRLHQHGFRVRVLEAYRRRCAMCALRRGPLLDAAHIVPHSEPEGLAVTANGLSLCKLHHAAYDQWLLGVRPGDLRIEVTRDVLDEIDGPMLRHGLQDLDGESLRVLPRRPVDRPSDERLAWRHERFRQHGGPMR
ncbi:hypothetical protein ER308_10350 [Egibacter rhizosphaerae]|uniref:HNH nuclease domain-containing protein n=1 Tax=Egibacter rhizosphaerae TaxID=1670831 RepID=A0A411YFB6_9ACTN|nr:HNH endonuclease [Egibacter rhizosphaerae]QBI19920.1 hypothetical protein ER308_10350 [Egibacter rhizosphaerae]